MGIRRSIPACAGEPPCPIAINKEKKVYPRVCGGTEEAEEMVEQGVGLSPRVRGNLFPFWRR